jgi:AcrR family transcriptional regulator
MVNHYFGSKDALYRASIRATFTELAALKDELAGELAAKAPSDELVARAIATGFRFAREHRVAVRLLVRAAVSTGELTRTGSRLLFDVLDQVSKAVGATLGRPPSELRLPLQSLVFLIARYATQSDAEMAKVVGISARGKAAVVDAVELHLVRVGLDGLGLSTRSRR